MFGLVIDGHSCAFGQEVRPEPIGYLGLLKIVCSRLPQEGLGRVLNLPGPVEHCLEFGST